MVFVSPPRVRSASLISPVGGSEGTTCTMQSWRSSICGIVVVLDALQILRGCLRAFRVRPGARGGADRSETLLPSAASTQVTQRPILVERALVGLGREVVDFRRKTYYDTLPPRCSFPRQNQHQRHRLLPDPASAFQGAERYDDPINLAFMRPLKRVSGFAKRESFALKS